jgi:type IV secretion system protein VirB10
MPGADSAGYSGFSDQTNNHSVRLFGSALLMSAVVAASSLSQLNGNNSGGNNTGYYGQQTTAGTLNQALGQQLGQVTAQMIAKNLNIAPTLEIRPGFRFNVVVTKDLTFTKPYQAFDYSIQE